MWSKLKKATEALENEALRAKVSQLKENHGKLTAEQLRKAYNRVRMHYDAAKTDRTRKSWGTSNDTPYGNIKSDISNLISRSRFAYDNDTYFKSAINSIVNNTVSTGLKPKARVMQNNGEPAKTINRSLDEAWKRYQDEWDRRGMLTFNEGQRLALKTTAISGGVLSNTVQAEQGKLLPIAKQLIEPDRLDTSHDNERVTITENEPARQTLHGVSMDDYGKPLAYWIQGVRNPIPSRNIIHTFIHERPEQHIGVPWGVQALDDIWNTHQLNEDTLARSRALADILFWFKPSSDPWSKDGDQDDDENAIIEKLMSIRTQEKPEVIQGDDSVTETVKPLTKMILQGVYASLGSSYMTVSRDMEGVNFAASRAVLVEERQAYRGIRQWFSESYCQKEWEDFVWWAVFSGLVPGIPIERFLRNSWKYTRAVWRGRGWDWIDPAKDSKALIEMKNAGLKTDTEIIGERGFDIEDHYRVLSEEEELRKFYNINRDIQPEKPGRPVVEEDGEGTDE